LCELPPPPAGRSGWPWTEETPPLGDAMPDGTAWPRLSVVTPSYNQGRFIEETIRSVLLQGYPDLEYLIIDGGSSDQTLEIIHRYEPWIAAWVSEKDRGQTDALNKGFRRATGLFVGWQNSDDYYGPHALGCCAAAAQANPDADVLHGTSHFIDLAATIHFSCATEKFVLAEETNAFPLFGFSNQSMFFSRNIFAGGTYLDEERSHAMDNDFFVRLIAAGATFAYAPGLVGFCRLHAETKTVYQQDVGLREACAICRNALTSDWVTTELRPAILRGFRTHLVAMFRNGQTDDFRKGVKDLVRLGGMRMLDLKFMLRYAASFLGGRIVRCGLATARQLHSLGHPRPQK
jgi:glycosyltransferase involved in cell wall biosynthesis